MCMLSITKFVSDKEKEPNKNSSMVFQMLNAYPLKSYIKHGI